MTACVKCGHNPAAKVVGRWAFTIGKRVESGNMYTVNSGRSRWRYAATRNEWADHVLVAVSVLRRDPHGYETAGMLSKRRITITRHYAGRCKAIDVDNLSAGVKPLVDALVGGGVLHDDDALHMELHVLQERDAKNETHVLVEELA